VASGETCPMKHLLAIGEHNAQLLDIASARWRMYVNLKTSIQRVSYCMRIEKLGEKVGPFGAEIILIFVELEKSEVLSALPLEAKEGVCTLYAMGGDGHEVIARESCT
jgi:hypothetical protein